MEDLKVVGEGPVHRGVQGPERVGVVQRLRQQAAQRGRDADHPLVEGGQGPLDAPVGSDWQSQFESKPQLAETTQNDHTIVV